MEYVGEKVSDIGSYLEQLPKLSEKTKGDIFYRGQTDISYQLIPSVFRADFKVREHNIYTEIMTECAHEFEDCKLHNEILSKMQHYGVPTRLLDVTTNALVALYFACDDYKKNEKADGVVFVIQADDSKIKQFDSDAISILASLPRISQKEKQKILTLAKTYLNDGDNKKTIQKFNNEVAIKRLLHEIKKEKPAFENVINPRDLLTNYFFVPRKNNARIIRQSGAFVIFGLEETEIKINSYKNFDFNNKSYKIFIEKNKKKTIIEQLSVFGISKATLHPELYKVAEYIKEK